MSITSDRRPLRVSEVRTARLQIALTEQERVKLTELARAHGCSSAAEFIRRSTLQHHGALRASGQ